MSSNTVPIEVLKRELVGAFDQRHLHLIISPTEQCNFRCTYCYEDFSIGKMSQTVYSSLEKFISKRMPELRTFSLSWFGGEPMLCASMVESLTRHCNIEATAHNTRITGVSITTNGWHLTPERFDRLTSLGIAGYQISLDGDADAHNATRKLAGGQGTFDRIYANLLHTRSMDRSIRFRITLRLHIHADNIDPQIRLVDRLAADFGDDDRYNIHLKRVSNLGGEGVKEMRLVGKSGVESIEDRVKAVFYNARGREQPAPGHYTCYAAKPNSLFVRPTGQVAKCTVALNAPDNNIGRVLENGDLEVDTARALLWSFGFRTQKSSDLGCPASQMSKYTPIRIVPSERRTDGQQVGN